MKSQKPKVLVSVWNDFWGVHLSEGLIRAGFDVTYHHTGSRGASGARDFRNWPAAILNRAGFKGWLKQKSAFALSRKLVDMQAARLCKRSDVFWGWSGCSLQALRYIKQLRMPGILERGSTHCDWQRRVVGEQFAKHGMSHLFHYPEEHVRYDREEYALADRICVPSRYVAQTFPRHGVPESKLFMNPYGVDVDFWSRCDPSARAEARFTFLYVASIGLRKGIADLLEAWKSADLMDAKLLFVGGVSPEARPFMKNLPKNVETRGFASHEEIRSLMGSCHAYILPSYEEGLARSVLEAAAAGLAPIITEETGATDILQPERDALLVPSGCLPAIAAAMKTLAQNQSWAEEIGKNAQNATRNSTWKAYGDRCASLLKQIIK